MLSATNAPNSESELLGAENPACWDQPGDPKMYVAPANERPYGAPTIAVMPAPLSATDEPNERRPAGSTALRLAIGLDDQALVPGTMAKMDAAPSAGIFPGAPASAVRPSALSANEDP